MERCPLRQRAEPGQSTLPCAGAPSRPRPSSEKLRGELAQVVKSVCHLITQVKGAHVIPRRCMPDSGGDSRIGCKMIQAGKRRVVCHGPGGCGADGLYGR